MKRITLLSLAVAGVILAALVCSDAPALGQEKKPTAKQKMESVKYLVGSWGCAHTVGKFSGKYTTKYMEVHGGRWLRETYDFPAGQFGSDTQPEVTAEALIGYDEERSQWVRFFVASTGDYFPIRLKDNPNGWTYWYVSFFRSRPEPEKADATFTKISDTEYSIEGPTYPENGTLVTEHHSCHKLE